MYILTDILRRPIDEGAKNTAFNILKSIRKLYKSQAIIFSLNSSDQFEFIDGYFLANKFLLNRRLLSALRNSKFGKVLYLPEASATLASFIRAYILSMFSKKQVIILSLQSRKYNKLVRLLINFLKPQFIITLSRSTSNYLRVIGIASKSLPMGVDFEKFSEFQYEDRLALRRNYNIPLGKTVLLHIGHIKASRNLKWLISVKQEIPEIEIIVVSSTYNTHDKILYQMLIKNEIIVMDSFIPNIEEIYNIADYYIFPVQQTDGAIETPLSVIEAMACNLRIITTRFGSLPDVFIEDANFHYVDSSDDIIEILKAPNKPPCMNRKKINSFSWDRISQKLFSMIENSKW